MKRIALSFAVLGMLAVFNAPASASDLSVFLRGGSYGGRYIAQQNHSAHHQDLGHRAYHRELDHNAAHRYPMSYRQHGQLHDSLNHEAFHDNLEHNSAHRTRAYSPNRSSYSRGYAPSFGSPYSRGFSSQRYGNPGSCYAPSGLSFSLGF